jgi:hypothetical protein
MQNNPNGPYDDVFSNLAKIVDEIVRNMPDNQHARIVGYTIITRSPGEDDPEVFHAGPPRDDEGIPYEVTESEDSVYITATMPADPRNAPVVDIEPDRVLITVDDKSVTIVLDHAIDRTHCYYRIHRGVMDITLKKRA